MARTLKWIFIVAAAALSVLAGVSLSKLGADRMMEKPTNDMAYAVDNLNKGGLTSFANQIGNAKSEILISARELTSGALLEALNRAHNSGVAVRVLLDPRSNVDPTRGALGYLRANGIPTRISNGELFDQILLIDGKALFLTSAPWTPEAAKQQGLAHLIVSKGAGNKVTRIFNDSWAAAKKV